MGVAHIVDGHAERFSGEIKDPKTIHEHLHRYAFAGEFVTGKKVLDLASGEGYGSWIMARKASSITGVDLDPAAVAHARQKYRRDNLTYREGSIDQLPFADGEFDVVTCFEAIEHIESQRECIREACRVLKQDGLLLISTPFKAEHDGKSANPFHIHELTCTEFNALLSETFRTVRIVGQRAHLVSNIFAVGEPPTSGRPSFYFNTSSEESLDVNDAGAERKPDFFIALASNSEAPPVAESFLMEPEGDSLAYLNDMVERLNNQLKQHIDMVHEKDWALECASRILVKKAESSAFYYRKALQSDAGIANLANRLQETTAALQKMLADSYKISPVPGCRPAAVTSKISVIVPTKNGGKQLQNLLAGIKTQERVGEVEIIVIDSESTDDSVRFAQEAGARVITVSQQEFNHGMTRNRGAAEASGEFYVFTVQDALPAGNSWLYNLVSPFLVSPQLAAASSKQLVTPQADMFSLWENRNLEKYLGYGEDSIIGKVGEGADFAWKFYDATTKRRITFLDNVSSCIRADVFKELQFSPYMNAEDMDYGIRIFRKGLSLGYFSSAGVCHWHERTPDYFLKRNYIGMKAMVHILGEQPSFFFTANGIGFDHLMARLIHIYQLIEASFALLPVIPADPKKACTSFLTVFRDLLPTIVAELDTMEKGPGECHLSELFKTLTGVDALSCEHDSAKEFLTGDFFNQLVDFGLFANGAGISLKNNRQAFVAAVHKIFAIIAGNGLGTFYLEKELRGELNDDLRGMDRTLARGICYF